MSTSTYTIAELIRKWGKGELTNEQVIGHLLQHLAVFDTRQNELEKRLRQLEQSSLKP
jgi:hypothetical protein